MILSDFTCTSFISVIFFVIWSTQNMMNDESVLDFMNVGEESAKSYAI